MAAVRKYGVGEPNRWSSLLSMIRAIPILFLQLLAVMPILGCGASESQLESGGKEKMKSQFTFPKGITVNTPNGIHEGYSVTHKPEGYSFFVINVSAEHIPKVFLLLAAQVNEPGFLTLEVGTHRDVEAQLRRKETDPLHKNVYYCDGLTRAAVADIFQKYETLLTNDGGVSFGYGSHKGHDEVFVAAYKIFHIYADEPEKYRTTLAQLGFAEEPQLTTVWDTFTKTSPGTRTVLRDGPITIWNMIEELKGKG